MGWVFASALAVVTALVLLIIGSTHDG